jgi:hypothetical protein
VRLFEEWIFLGLADLKKGLLSALLVFLPGKNCKVNQEIEGVVDSWRRERKRYSLMI